MPTFVPMDVATSGIPSMGSASSEAVSCCLVMIVEAKAACRGLRREVVAIISYSKKTTHETRRMKDRFRAFYKNNS